MANIPVEWLVVRRLGDTAQKAASPQQTDAGDDETLEAENTFIPDHIRREMLEKRRQILGAPEETEAPAPPKAFNPNQPRGAHGRFSSSGSGGAGAATGGSHGGATGGAIGGAHAVHDFAKSTLPTHVRSMVNNAVHSLPGEQVGRAAHVIKMTHEINDGGHTTDAIYDRHPNAPGKWDPARQRVLEQLVHQHYQQYADVKSEGKAWVMGGLGGAGKSTLIKNKGHEFGLRPGSAVTINPDEMKDVMLSHGLAPGYDHLHPGELAPQIHEESSYMASMLEKLALRDHKNIVYDVTLGSQNKGAKIVAGLTKAGYQKHNITGVFVDVPLHQSLSAALTRWKGGAGRFVDPNHIASQYDKTPDGKASTQYQSVNRRYFEDDKHHFGRAIVYDNGGFAQRMVSDTGPATPPASMGAAAG